MSPYRAGRLTAGRLTAGRSRGSSFTKAAEDKKPAPTFFSRANRGTAAAGFDEMRMEAITVPVRSGCAGHTLAGLAPTHHSGVQIAGINRGGGRILNPGADEILREGDEVLVLGTPEQIDTFKALVREQADPDGPPPG